MRTTTPRSAGSSTASSGTKRARQSELFSLTSSGKRQAPAPTSAQPQVSTRAPDDDWFRERGQVLPRGDDSDGIRRTGRIRRPPPATHSTHSIFASVNEAKSDSDSSSALPRTEHQSRAQACEDANLIPSFLAHEVKPTAKDTSDWDLADSREWDGLIKMGCFEWVSDNEQLPGERIYSSRFVRVVKDKYPSSHPKHFKSRLVVQQLKRIHRDDPGELYSPTPSQESARLLTWYAARQGERIFGIDCVQAYLNSPAPTAKGSRIFIRPPKERKKSGHILLLHKYLYGLRRAAKAWNMTLLKAFKAMGFRSLRTELCVLVRDPSGQRPTIVDFHVDDIRVVGDAQAVIRGLRKNGIEVTDEGLLTRHLGIEYEFRPDGIFTHMRTAELKLLKTFGYLPGQCKTYKVPLADDSQWDLRRFKTGVKGLTDIKMSSLLGAALWIRRGVRLDLSVAFA